MAMENIRQVAMNRLGLGVAGYRLISIRYLI